MLGVPATGYVGPNLVRRPQNDSQCDDRNRFATGFIGDGDRTCVASRSTRYAPSGTFARRQG